MALSRITDITPQVIHEIQNIFDEIESVLAPGGGSGLGDPGGNGIVVRTALGVTTPRAMANAAAGLTWTNADGVSGNMTPVFANDLGAIEALSGTGFAKRTGTDMWSVGALVASDIPDLSATYQPLDADLTAIAALAGTSGHLKKTAANTWALDTTAYVSVVGAGSLTSTALVTGGGSQTLQTPSPTSTLDASGNLVVAGNLTANGNEINVGGGGSFLALSDATSDATLNATTLNIGGAGVGKTVNIGGANALVKLPGLATDGFLKSTNATGQVFVDVLSITTTSPLSGGPFPQGTGTLSLLVNVDFGFTATQTIAVNNAVTNAITDLFVLAHNSTGTPTANFGGGIKFTLESSTTADQDAARIGTIWTNATHALRTSAFVIQTVVGGVMSEVARFTTAELTLSNNLTVTGNLNVLGDEAVFDAPVIPASSDGAALGSTTRQWSDLFLAEGGVINWDNGDVTITQTGNILSFAGASTRYEFDANLTPSTNDGAALGTSALMFSDLFLASGAIVNFNNGDVTLTHSSNLLTLAGGNLTVEGLTAGGITVNGDISADVLIANTSAEPDTNDGATLGSTSKQWSDIFLASGAVINFANGDVTITHSSNLLTVTGGGVTLDSLTVTGNSQFNNDMTVNAQVDAVGFTVGVAGLAPASNDGAQIGSGTTQFSDLFLASGGIINWNNGNATITHSAGLLTSNVDVVVPAEVYGSGWNGSNEVPTKNDVYDKIESITLSGGANTALSNLSSVAINAALVLGTNDAFALGSATKQWSDLFLAEGGVINWDNGDATLTQVGNVVTLAGADFVADNITVNTALLPDANDGAALGTTALQFSDIFLAEGGVINWDNGDVTITQTGNVLSFAGAATRYEFDANLAPTTSDGAALGTSALMFSDLFLASGAVVNFNNGNTTLTHSAGLLTLNVDFLASGLLKAGSGPTTLTDSAGKILSAALNTVGIAQGGTGQTGGFATAQYVRVYNSANIAITSGSPTMVTFNSERDDTNGFHSTSSNTSRITFPVAGVYIVIASIEMTASALGTYRQVQIILNGATTIASLLLAPNAAAIRLFLPTEYRFAVNDYVEVQVTHDAGVNQNVLASANYSPEFMASYVGP